MMQKCALLFCGWHTLIRHRGCFLFVFLSLLFYNSYAVSVSGNIGSSTTWSGVISLDGNVFIPSGATLTITPGTTITATGHFTINVLSSGRIMAIGDASNIITFTANNHVNGWGGIRFSYNRSITVGDSSVLRYCNISYGINAFGFGGAIYAASSTGEVPYMTLSFCSINNSSTGSGSGGGGYFFDSDIDNCTFTGNTSGGSGIGGGGYFYNSTVDNCTFTNNTSGSSNTGGGGGGYFYNSTVNYCTFINNASNALPSGSGGGGGGYIRESEANHCIFTGNSSTNVGGGAYIRNSIADSCSFINNNADDAGGGAFFFDANINHSIFTNNATNTEGGGLSCFESNIYNCFIANNTAVNNGGGATFWNSKGRNSIFTNNTASGTGGGVFAYENAIFINCMFLGNYSSASGGGGYFVSNGTEVTNSIFWNNDILTGFETQYSIGLTATMDYCHVWEQTVTGTSNKSYVTGTPAFVNPTTLIGTSTSPAEMTEILNADWHLNITSPTIDVGSNTPWTLTDEDKDGTLRIQGCIVDIGAYEHPEFAAPTFSVTDTIWRFPNSCDTNVAELPTSINIITGCVEDTLYSTTYSNPLVDEGIDWNNQTFNLGQTVVYIQLISYSNWYSLIDTVVIMVADTVKPVLSITDTIRYYTNECNTIFNFIDSLTVTESCGVADTFYSSNQLNPWLNIANITQRKDTVKYYILVTDSNNNKATDSVVVMVIDTEKSVLLISDTMRYYTNECNVTFNLIDSLTFSEPCGMVGVFYSSNLLDPWLNLEDITQDKETIRYYLLVTDSGHNQTIDSVVVTVTDTTKPVLLINDTVQFYTEQCSSTFNLADVLTVIEPCGMAGIFYSSNLLDPWLNLGDITQDKETIRYYLLVTDSSYNQTIDSVVVVVTDTTKPVLLINDTVQFYTGKCSRSSTFNLADFLTIIEPCGMADIFYSSNLLDPWLSLDNITLNENTIKYYLLVADNANNQTIDSVVVIVTDTTKPVLLITDTVQFYTEQCSSTFNLADVLTVIEPCGVVNIFYSSNLLDPWLSLDNITLNDNTIKYYLLVADNANKQTIDSVVVMVTDTTKPIFALTDTVLYLTQEGVNSIYDTSLITWKVDNCQLQYNSPIFTTYNCHQIGYNSLPIVITDIYGNNTMHEAYVNVIDTFIRDVSIEYNISIDTIAATNLSLNNIFEHSHAGSWLDIHNNLMPSVLLNQMQLSAGTHNYTFVPVEECAIRCHLIIHVLPNYDIYIKQHVITLNGDGRNDYLRAINRGDWDVDNELLILNIWGVEIFNKKGIKTRKLWEGVNNSGQLVNKGIYWYIFRFKDKVKKSWVEVL